ncbi:MAG TPA: ABC transporter permease [Candidatus Solibacter sp.]|jgi:peptide/nickel transport system permease protein|nr:ABC transporter permease [Candidatus Solibacter sp.]
MRIAGRLPFALWCLAGIHLLVTFAGFVAPYRFDTQERFQSFAPPTRVHFFDFNGTFHLRPFVYAVAGGDENSNEYREDRSAMYPIGFFAAGEEYSLFGIWPCHRHLFGVNAPARIYLLGADGFGRDQLSRLLYGGRVSLFGGFLAAALSVLLGLGLGAIAGFYGGRADDVVMRVADIFIVVPWFYLLLAIRAVLPLQIQPEAAFLLVVATIGFVGWARPARLVRGVVLSQRERTFVLAARGFGASNLYLLRRHILPSAWGVALTQMAVLIPQFILAEVILSFLGLGIGEPVPSWGNMLAYAQQYHILISYWWMLLPGVAPVPVFLAYHGLADYLHARLQSVS